MPFLSIVIPAYNEERRLPATLRAVDEYLNQKNWPGAEVIVVDDGSRDDTAAVAEAFGGRVRVLRNPVNRGKGYSVRHGMLAAQGEWVLFSDADLSAPIEELDKLLAANAPVAIGSRALNRGLIGVHQSWFRENAGRLFNVLMWVIIGLPFSDTQCGFKLYSREAAQAVFSRQTIDGFGFDAEALFIAAKHGFRIVEVPVRWSHADGTKVSMFGDSANMFADLLRTRWNALCERYK